MSMLLFITLLSSGMAIGLYGALNAIVASWEKQPAPVKVDNK